MRDFPDKELGKAVPYGVYDIVRNEGWVNVGINDSMYGYVLLMFKIMQKVHDVFVRIRIFRILR